MLNSLSGKHKCSHQVLDPIRHPFQSLLQRRAFTKQPRRLLARIWVLIGIALDGDIQQLAGSTALVWVPAHTSPSSIGEAKRSDGARLTHIDWRANRLADGLAKQAAAIAQPPPAVLRLLASAFAAVRHAARLLACVTHAANNHTVSVTAGDGTVSNKVVRDSVDKPRAKQKPRVTGPTPLPPPPPKPDRQVAAWAPTSGGVNRSASSATAATPATTPKATVYE